jgi:hypothetical protein
MLALANTRRTDNIREFLTPEEIEEIESEEPLTIEQARDFITQNSIKETEITDIILDPEIVLTIEPRVDFNIFITKDHIYTREELYKNYAFAEFGMTPEVVFTQQEIGMFENDEYAIRDVGKSEFIVLSDMLNTSHRGASSGSTPIKIAKTKFYIGRERWDDYILIHRMARGANTLATYSTTCKPLLCVTPLAMLTNGEHLTMSAAVDKSTAADMAAASTAATVNISAAPISAVPTMSTTTAVKITPPSNRAELFQMIEELRNDFDRRIKFIESMIVNICDE